MNNDMIITVLDNLVLLPNFLLAKIPKLNFLLKADSHRIVGMLAESIKHGIQS